MSSEIFNEFKKKILATDFSEGTITEVGGNIEIKTSYAVGSINFHELEVNIVEMIVTNLADDENKFYLHFELRDLAYAEELFAEMLETIIELKNHQKLKILLSCTGGMTTSYFAEKLNDAANLLSLNYEFNAVPFYKLYEVAVNYSVILLAPQIAYQMKTAQDILNNQLVLKIPPKVFASYDSAEILKFIRESLENWKKTSAERVIAKVRAGLINSNAKILSIAIMPSNAQSRIAYRIYKNGEPIFEETVIKNKLNYINDLCDILDTVACRCKKFDAIGIATAGTVRNGHLELSAFISPDINLKKLLEEKYKVPVTITNNLKSAALGYYVQQDKYENILFVSRPYGFRCGGLGMILNGKVFNGAHNMAGEIRYTMRSVLSKSDWDSYYMTDLEKVLDTVSFEIRAGISVVDPEVICLRSPMTPDIEKVKDKLKEYIPAEYLPEFVYLRDEEMQEYVLLGQMILSLENLETKK
jgi:cellobiose-specific phosphotransferase system component IIB